MARKLNRKFIIIVGGVTVVAVLGVGGIAAWRISTAPERNIAAGDVALAEGKINEAVERYGRAANKRPHRSDYWAKYVAALAQQPTNTSQAGTQNFFQLLAGRSKLAESDPAKVEPLKSYLDQLGETNPADVALACGRIRHLYASHPKQATMIDTVALTAALRQWESKRAGLDDTERKLLDIARMPEVGVEPWLGLIEYSSARLDAARRANIGPDIAKWSELLDGYIAQAIAANPDEPRLQIAVVLKTLGTDRQLRRNADEAESPKAFVALCAQAKQELARLQSIDVINILRIGRLLGTVHRDAAVELTQDWLEQHPDSPLVIAELAGVLQESAEQADRDEAVALGLKLRDSATFTPGPAALGQDALRVRAAQGVFDARFASWLETTDEAKRAALVPQLDEAVQGLRRIAGAGNDSVILRCEALVQFARGQYGPALRGLERVVSGSDADTLAMVVAIEAALKRDEIGVAQQLSARAAARFPSNAKILEGALRVAQSAGRSDEALALAERLRTIEPQNALAGAVIAAQQDPGRLPPAQDALDAQLRKAFQDSKGDPRVLAASAQALVAANPADVRPRLMLVEAISRGGDRDATIKAVDEALALFPDNEILKARKQDLATTDPVERLRLVAAQRGGSEAEQLMFQASTLLASEPAFEQASTTAPTRAERERITAELTSIRKGIDEIVPKALAASPGNETLLVLMAERGVRRADQAFVDQALKAAAASSDPKVGTLVQAVVALRAGDAQKVIDLIRADAEAPNADAVRLRVLGEAYLAEGSPAKAAVVLGRAFERQPTNAGVARLYADALLASGDAAKALSLLASAAAASPTDADLANRWLAAEARLGDRGRALLERRRRALRSPDDLTNARGLAALLLEMSPDPTTILDDQLKPKYSATQWDGMQLANREDAIRRARDTNVAEAKEILATIRLANPNDLDALGVQVQGLTALGDVAGAEAAMRAAETTVTRGLPAVFLMEADFFNRTNKPELAVQALDRALETADGDATIIRSVARLRAGRGEVQAALTALTPLLAGDASNNDLREAARWSLVVRKPDEAAALLARVKDGNDKREQFATQLVRGMVALNEVITKQEQGDRAGMDAAYAKVNSILSQAAALNPRSAVPYVSQAEIAMQMYRRTGERSYLDACLKAADAAQQLDQLSVSTARLRWTALEAKGDAAGAVREAKRMLAALPKDAGIRMDLVSLLLRTGDPAGARSVLEEAVQGSALNAIWLRRLAEIQEESRQWSEAGQSYERAYASDRSIGSLELAARMYLSKDPPDLRGLSSLLRAYPEPVRQSMYLQSARSAGECLSGAREAGLVNLRSLYEANARAGAARQPVQGWYDILHQVFKIRSSQSELEAFDAFVRQVADMKDAETLRQLAAAWTFLGNAPPAVLAKAKEYAELALAAAGTDRVALGMGQMSLGNVLYRMGDCAGATKAFDAVVQAFPSQFDALNNYAYVEASCGDAKKALEIARRAAALDPTNIDGMDTLALAQLKSGDAAGAEVTLLRGLEVRQTATMLLHLAQAQQAQSRKDAAKASLTQALALAKDQPLPESEAAEAKRLEETLK